MLKSLESHNNEKAKVLGEVITNESFGDPNGLACPKCGNELVDQNTNVLLMSNPAKCSVFCKLCKHEDYRLV